MKKRYSIRLDCAKIHERGFKDERKKNCISK